MIVSSAVRNHRTLVARTAIAAAVLGMVVLVPVVGSSRADATTPKLGAKCLNSERGRTTNTLVCSKVGTKISWVRRKNPVTAATKQPPVIGGSTTAVPRPLDVIALVNGTGPAGASIKIDVTCTGLGGTPAQATQSASFSAQGGTQALNFNLLDPGTANPTGSSCTAVATVAGAAPTLRILVDGRPVAGPGATTLAAPAFVPRGQSAVTVLVDFGSTAAPAPANTLLATTTTVAGPTTTTVLGATTTTIAGTPTAPPASGRPEASARFIGIVPPGLTAVDVASTCTSPTPGAPFQTASTRFGRANATAILPQTLAPASGTNPATSCQLTASLLGTDLGNPSLRVLLNGLPIAGPTSGALINSPAFLAPSAFGATIEIIYPGGATTTTTPGATTTTVPGATTTTVAGVPAQTNVSLARTGNAPPASVTGYVVTLDCQNVRLGGGLFPAAQFTPIFGPTGGSSSYSIGYEANTTCVVKVATSVSAGNPAVTTGNIAVAVNNALLPATTNGAFTSGIIAATTPLTVAVTVSY